MCLAAVDIAVEPFLEWLFIRFKFITNYQTYFFLEIPVFCWITAKDLEEVLKTQGEDLPQTLSEIYFLVVQSTSKNNRGDNVHSRWNPESSKMIKILAKLAFE